MDFGQLCRAMQIVDGPPENLRPRNVGLLFFTDDPSRFIPQVQIDVAHFPEGKAGEIREKRFTGPLGKQLREALAYLESTFIVERVLKRGDRAEADRFVSYPYAAIEEALANAVYHRGYDAREPIEVQVTPKEMTITSYPGPDISVRIDDLNRGGVVARRYRNRRVGEFLKELRLRRGAGRACPASSRRCATTALPARGSRRTRSATTSSPFSPSTPWRPARRMRRGGGGGERG